MRIHYLQHIDFENIGYISKWANNKNYKVAGTKLFLGEKLPELYEFDVLIIMGGPMNIYEYDSYSWLKEEKRLIKQAIENNKYVIGFCLGAQLIADVLGGTISKNREKELGWFEIEKTEESYFESIDKVTVFHWHGDTFTIPKNAMNIFKSKGCENQAFIYSDNVLAFQCHMEMEEENISLILKNCREELSEKGKFIQNEREIKDKKDYILDANRSLGIILNEFIKSHS